MIGLNQGMEVGFLPSDGQSNSSIFFVQYQRQVLSCFRAVSYCQYRFMHNKEYTSHRLSTGQQVANSLIEFANAESSLKKMPWKL
jgi:hypothetical protein